MRRSLVVPLALVVLALSVAGCLDGTSPSAGSPSAWTPSTGSPFTSTATSSPVATATSSPVATAPSSPTASATSSPTATPPAAACPEATESTDVSVPSWPERPDSFDRESALAFAARFERALVTRRTIRDYTHDFTSVSVRVETRDHANVTRTDDGWLVSFRATGPYARWRVTPGSTETDHWDPGRYVARYRLTDDRVIRSRHGERENPPENGRIVPCPPG